MQLRVLKRRVFGGVELFILGRVSISLRSVAKVVVDEGIWVSLWFGSGGWMEYESGICLLGGREVCSF
jgi:hypothetical protein